MRKLLLATCLGSTFFHPLTASADADFQVGDFVRQTQHWDSEKKHFVPGAAEGEGEGCWRVLSVDSKGVKMKLESGLFKPWWSEEPIAVGSSDTWFDSELFREANPGMPPLSEIRKTFETVSSCD